MNDSKQPRALYLLFFVQMWECFSYYGMRTLLVLYLSQVLQFSDLKTFSIFAVYSALKEFGGVLGGRLADSFCGRRNSIQLGAFIIAVGHVCMMVSSAEFGLYLGLSFIAIGTGLFSTNIASLLGAFYAEKDPRREAGYTLFYVGINLGAVLATVVCGIFCEYFGYHAGFGAAAGGMFLAIFSLLSFSGALEDKGVLDTPLRGQQKALLLCGIFAAVACVAGILIAAEWSLVLLPWACLAAVAYAVHVLLKSGLIAPQAVLAMGGYLLLLIGFFSVQEQLGSSLLLFTERCGSGNIFGISLPSSIVVGVNPFVIIVFGTLSQRLLKRCALTTSARITAGLVIAALSFGLLGTIARMDQTPLLYIVLSVALLSVGELLVGPVVYAYFSQATPQQLQGVTMGLIPVGFSLASLLAGFFSQRMGPDVESVVTYSTGFTELCCFLLLLAAITYGITRINVWRKIKPYESY